MGIVAQFAGISAMAVAPSSDLYTGIPFVLILFFGGGSGIACLFYPTAYTEFLAGAEQLVLQQNQVQEFFVVLIEASFVEVLEVGNGMVINDASTVGNGLAYNIYQIVFKVIVSSVLVGYFNEQTGSFGSSGGVVVVLHLRPTGYLEVFHVWTSAEDGFVRTLLVIATWTVIDFIGENHPCLFNLFVLHSIACKNIILQPFFFGKLFWAPRKFAHQFKHHRIVFTAFERQSKTGHVLG